MSFDRKKSEVLKHGTKSQGMTNYLKYLNGKKIGLKGAVLAKCFDCMGYFADGRSNCGMEECSLYPWMPYKHGKEEALYPLK